MMLILERRTGEAILIDRRIVVAVLQLRRGRVRIGIEAPREISVVRSELESCDNSLQESNLQKLRGSFTEPSQFNSTISSRI